MTIKLDLQTVDVRALGKVAVLMGGSSAEREVSLMSGTGVLKALRDSGIDAHAFDPAERNLSELKSDGFQRCFIALHGRYGEDGCIQGVLEIMRVPYTHSGVLASAIAMDKPLARHVFASLGLRVAEGRVIERRSLAAGDPMPRPYVVKPIDQGSSIGVHIVRDGDNLAAVDGEPRHRLLVGDEPRRRSRYEATRRSGAFDADRRRQLRAARLLRTARAAVRRAHPRRAGGGARRRGTQARPLRLRF